jgi:hypothetical protein
MTSSSHLAKRNPRTLALNAVIVLLGVVVVYLAYAFVVRHVLNPPVSVTRTGDREGGVIQIDVLNGCGVAGAATAFTTYLRARGYDVVEMRNYKTFGVEETLVIDRTGQVGNAEKVAYALGVKKGNIVRQINEDYFVDVSVLIGKDYKSLKPSHEGETK